MTVNIQKIYEKHIHFTLRGFGLFLQKTKP